MPDLYQADLSPFSARIRIQLRAKGREDFDFVLPPRGPRRIQERCWRSKAEVVFITKLNKVGESMTLYKSIGKTTFVADFA